MNEKIDALVSDREYFNRFVYTSLDEAIEELKRRQGDSTLEEKLKPYLEGRIPKEMAGGMKAVMFRQIVTPNYETRRFLSVPDTTDLSPVFWEYHDDKFTSNNVLKYHWGKLSFHQGVGKDGLTKRINKNVIDFNQSNGKKLKELKTFWGQGLIDFHHELLESNFPHITPYLYDASDWFTENGGSAKSYYKNFIAMFVNQGILFENFEIEGDENQFIKEVFLPAFIEIEETTGKKPLIVALEPTEIEGDIFWLSHTPETKEIVEKKLNNSQIEV